jgi:hypothetical protein
MNGRSIVGALRAADSYTFVHGYFPLPTANYVISGRMREEGGGGGGGGGGERGEKRKSESFNITNYCPINELPRFQFWGFVVRFRIFQSFFRCYSIFITFPLALSLSPLHYQSIRLLYPVKVERKGGEGVYLSL